MEISQNNVHEKYLDLLLHACVSFMEYFIPKGNFFVHDIFHLVLWKI